MINPIDIRHFGKHLHIGVLVFISLISNSSLAQIPALDITEVIELKGHGDSVNSIAFNPNGDALFSGGDDGQAIWWNFAKITSASAAIRQESPSAMWELNRKKIGEQVVSVAYNGIGDTCIASGVTHWGNGFGADTLLFVSWRPEPFSLGGGKVADSYTSVALDARAQFALLGAKNDELRLVRLGIKRNKKGEVQKDFLSKTAPGIPGPVTFVAIHPTKPLVAAAGSQGWIQLYSVNADGLEKAITKEPASHSQGNKVTGLKFTSDGSMLLSSARDRKLNVFDIKTGRTVHSWQPANTIPLHFDLHPKYPLILIAYDDGIPRIVNATTGEVVESLPKHSGQCRAAAFSADGRFAATGGEDHIIRIVDLGLSPKKKRR